VVSNTSQSSSQLFAQCLIITKTAVLEADNCVFHTLALANPNICQFDLALLAAFTDSAVDHQECMAKGGNICRFKFGGNNG